MSSSPHLEKLRIGCVQYLNAKPLIHGYEGHVHFDHPAKLAEMLSGGALDIALVSTYELFRMPGYEVVDGVSISSRGEVYSVFLAYKGEMKSIKTVSLDCASLTGSHLVRCLLAEYHGLSPDYVSPQDCTDEDAARLLIGNQAIDFRRAHGDEYHYLDLGSEWLKQTALPFVFAAWLVRKNTPHAAEAADELRSLKQHGTASIPDIVSKDGRYDAGFEKRYLTEYIRYDLGDAEKAGMEKFRALLAKYAFISPENGEFGFI